MAGSKPTIGKPYPLGSVYDGKGVNFALFSAHAEKVELCLFDKTGAQEVQRYAITENDNSIWHIYVPGLEPGQSTATAFMALTGRKRASVLIRTSC